MELQNNTLQECVSPRGYHLLGLLRQRILYWERACLDILECLSTILFSPMRLFEFHKLSQAINLAETLTKWLSPMNGNIQKIHLLIILTMFLLYHNIKCLAVMYLFY